MFQKVFSSFQSLFNSSYDWIPTYTSQTSHQLDPSTSQLFAGKLLLRQDIPLDEQDFQALCTMDYFQPVQAIVKHQFRFTCRRCGNNKKTLFSEIPCSRCHQRHVYCRKCIEMGRVLACEPLYVWTGPTAEWERQETPCTWQGSLTNSQQQASDRITKAMVNGNEELMVWAVCGAGKTEMLFEGIAAAIAQGKRVCLATPRADVVRELLPRFQASFPETTMDGLYGGSEDKRGTAQLILATTHQLIRYAHAFDVVIIDEIDAFPYHGDPSLPFVTNRAAKRDASMIYLTATPRKQQKSRVQANKLATVFVPVRFHGHPLPAPKLHLCFSLQKQLKAAQLPEALLKWYRKRVNPKRQLLIFVPTIELAEKIVPTLAEKLSISSITSVHSSDPERETKVQQLRHKEIFVLVTTTILERGVTFPSVDVVVLDAGHRVFDEAALVQIAGRAGRSPDDPTGEVIFFHDGRTNAMVEAVQSIKAMNKKGRTVK
ncbi:DEAD/DEAH box helicase [Aquibacillus albus]|uniref:Competence protein ComFA n=1 Tax=Aquibacillus albus TaxID=1168171 RepID=A0ABS2MWI3_9BACI|nr:DEAD/DEAH box helicase family protein [Aquibacillus albus]MBM7570251.1 competence protein ComFA [Aquibacillus albus]